MTVSHTAGRRCGRKHQVLCCALLPSIACSWMLLSPRGVAKALTRASPRAFAVHRILARHVKSSSSSSGYLDVDFERVDQSSTDQETWLDEKLSKDAQTELEALLGTDKTSLFDWSLESDREFHADTPVTFVDGFRDGEPAVDVHLAFMATLDGQRYGIGVPVDAVLALVMQDNQNDSIVHLSPDDDANEELLHVMAAQLQEHVGGGDEALLLRRTPRVLTVDKATLERHTHNWQRDLVPPSVDASKLLDDADEDEDDFFAIMKQELGDQEFDAVMNDDSDLDDDFVNLFNAPDQNDLRESMRDLLTTPLADQVASMRDMLTLPTDMQPGGSSALKLLSYKIDRRHTYSLVQMLQPVALVAKRVDEDDERGLRFELLSPAEAAILLPQIENVCKAELDKAGLSL